MECKEEMEAQALALVKELFVSSGKVKGVANENEICQWVYEDIVCSYGVINLDYHDALYFQMNVDVVDGCKEYGAIEDLSKLIKIGSAHLINAHIGEELKHIIVQLSVFGDAELMIDQMSELQEIFEGFDSEVECRWGLNKSEVDREHALEVLILMGFKKPEGTCY